MINRCIFSSFLWIAFFLCCSLSLGGPISLAPKPLLHDITDDNFSAKALLNKQPFLVKVGGGYPAIVLGGRVDAQLLNKLSWNANQVVDNILINMALCLDNDVMLVLPFRYKTVDQKSIAFSLKQFALVLGRYSKHNLQTSIGDIKLPFRVYGAIGKFKSPASPLASEIFCFKEVAPLTITIADCNASSKASFLIGIQRGYGLHSFNIALSTSGMHSRFIVSGIGGSIDYDFSGREYQMKGGVGYDSRYSRGLIHGSIVYSRCKLMIQQMFGNWHELSRRGWTKRSPGHLELTWDCVLTGQIPVTLAVGYGWFNDHLVRKESKYSVLGGALITVTDYAKLGASLKLSTVDWTPKNFNTYLVISF